MRWMGLAAGILMVFAGVVWTLQGLGVLGGSPMSDDTAWAVIGPIVAIGGLAVIAIMVRRGRGRS